MSVLDKLELRATGFRSVERDELMPLVSDEVFRAEPIERDFSDEFTLTVKLGAYVRAPSAAKNEAYRECKRMIAREIYKDVLDMAHNVKDMVWCNRKDDALNELCKMIDFMAGKENEH